MNEDKTFWKYVGELLKRARTTRLDGKVIMDSILRRTYGFSIDDKFRNADDAVNALYGWATAPSKASK